MNRLVWAVTSAVVSCSIIIIGTGATMAAQPGSADTGVVNSPFVGIPGSAAVPAARTRNYVASENWAGYVQATNTQGTFTQAIDSFVVPTVETSIKGTQFAADWVGIGGMVTYDRSLVQAGIQAESHQGRVSYTAWTEILPHDEKALAMTISPGDTVTVTVQEAAKNRWLMQVRDGGQIGSRTVKYRSSGESAEAIHERPCVRGSCASPNDFATLAQTSDVPFVPGSFSVTPPGQTPVETPLLEPGMFGGPIAIIMEGPSSYDDAGPSAPNAANNGFTVSDADSSSPSTP